MRALGVLADRDRRKATELAAAVGSTPGFVAQVLTPLVRAGWVRSDPGPSGGYQLTAAPGTVSVLDVIEAIEGPTVSGWCVLGDEPCEERGTCALHAAWARARAQLLDELAGQAIEDVVPAGTSS